MAAQLRVEVEGGPAVAILTDIVGPLDSGGWTGVLEPVGGAASRPPGEQITLRALDGEHRGQQATVHVDQTLGGDWPVTGITGFGA